MPAVPSPTPQRISVGIVADNDIVRETLHALVEDDSELRVAGVASDATAGRMLLRKSGLQVLVVSLSIASDERRAPGLSFIKSARRYREDIGILSLKRGIEEPAVRAAIDAGADACCLAGAPQGRLLRAIKAVSVGATWLDPEISQIVFRSRNPRSSPTPHLTQREHRVLQLITEGHTYAEMADVLNCSSGTIHVHVNHLYKKLGVHDRASAAVKAIRLGLISDNAF